MNTPVDHTLLSRIVDDLAEQGWSRQEGFLSPALTLALASECRQRAGAGEMKPATVGRGAGQSLRPDVRSDHIQWLEDDTGEAVGQYLARMDALRLEINRGLYLGLESFESHFALYPPGAFYRKHVDRFRDDDRRTVSAIVYLNPDWQAEDGGQLRMTLRDEREYDASPLGGSLVVFLSDEFPHEVLPAQRERLSLTGWFRRLGNDGF